MMTKTEPILLNPTQVADLVALSRSRVYQLIKAGAIPSVRIAGVTRVPMQGLRDWVARHLSAPTSQQTPSS